MLRLSNFNVTGDYTSSNTMVYNHENNALTPFTIGSTNVTIAFKVGTSDDLIKQNNVLTYI